MKQLLGLSLAAVLGIGAVANAQVIYSNIPGTPAGNYASQPYQAQQVTQFGNLLHFATGGRDMSQVSFLMSNWAYGSQYPSLFATNSTGFFHDFTLNIYAAGSGGSVGSLLYTTTQNKEIAWRPEPTPSCGGTRWLNPSDATCYNGYATRLNFDFGAGTFLLPDDVIIALGFNTETYGPNPVGAPGPYNSLNVGLGPTPTTVGSNDAGVAYVQTTYPGWTDGSFQRDNGWDDYAPQMEVSATMATPEPASLVLVGTGLLGVMGVSVRRRRKQ